MDAQYKRNVELLESWDFFITRRDKAIAEARVQWDAERAKLLDREARLVAENKALKARLAKRGRAGA